MGKHIFSFGIISSVLSLVWYFINNKHAEDNIIIYLSKSGIKNYKESQSNNGSFKILLNVYFTLEIYDFPVFYFPYPTSMNTRHETSYASDSNFQLHCDKIRRVLLF